MLQRPVTLRWLLLLAATGCALGACTVTGPPAGGTPYGLEERSHGHP